MDKDLMASHVDEVVPTRTRKFEVMAGVDAEGIAKVPCPGACNYHVIISRMAPSAEWYGCCVCCTTVFRFVEVKE